MWERASGVPANRPVPARSVFTGSGLFKVRLGATAEALLRSAGQPIKRTDGQTWRWCVKGNKTARVTAVLSRSGVVQMVTTNAPLHIAGTVRPGQRTSQVHVKSSSLGTAGNGARLGPIISSSGRLIYGSRNGRIAFVGVVDRKLSKAALRHAVRLGARKLA